MNIWKNKILIVGSFMLPAFLYCQEIPSDTTALVEKEIEQVTVQHLHVVRHIMIEKKGLNAADIETLNADDVAGLIAKSPGATVKSYGGLGGLKSISIRGLGGQHTAMMVDGFVMTNAQAGQMNLGQLQTDGLVYAESGVHQRFYNLEPVSSNFYGSFILFNTFQRYRRSEGQGVKASLRYGSFLRREAYVQGDKRKGKWHLAAFGKYRDAEGAYPFEFLNGANTSGSLRGNNDYQDVHFGLKVGREFKNHGRLNVYYRSSYIDQGLPGAVLFYNESADERMETIDHRVMIDYETHNWSNRYRVYLNAAINELNYHDPTYLNAAGFIHDRYQNSNIEGGYIHNRRFENFEMKWGAEQKVESLSTNRESLGEPFRSNTYGLVGVSKEFGRATLELTSGGQLVYDENIDTTRTYLQFAPNAFLKFNLRERLKLSFLYKRNFRLPSFNELYFGQIGNHNLEPEIAHQFNTQAKWIVRENYYRWHWIINTDAFFNRVRNKIVAVPSKNLFIWTIQNINEAAVYGATVDSRATRRFDSETRLEVLANYTWQRVIDVTPDAVTYGHQVAYAPEHLANLDFMLIRKGFSGRFSNNFVSGRYALNENIPANYLDPFWTMDIALGYQHTFKDKHKLGIQFNIRNIADVQYAFIRSFVMPGRHYLLTLNYEIF